MVLTFNGYSPHNIYRYVYMRKDCMECAKNTNFYYCMLVAMEVVGQQLWEKHAG